MSKNGSRNCFGSMECIKELFQRLDKNNDGKISIDTLKDVIGAFSPNASEEETKSVLKEFDPDGKGFIDFDEFVALFQSIHDGEDNNSEILKGAFDLYDLDGNGRISADELHSVKTKLGEKWSIEDCKSMISKFDSDGDGCIDFDEFKKMMTNGGS